MSGPGKGADRGAWDAARSLLVEEDDADVMRTGLLQWAGRSKSGRRGVAYALLGSSALERWADERDEPLPTDVRAAERFLRRAADRSEQAQVRSNPIRRNEGFTCVHCGHAVPPAPGGGVRNHCPRCLRSRHVDGAVPGDRASDCGGTMDPVSWERTAAGARVVLRCRRCGHRRSNRLHFDWSVDPDRDDALRALVRH